MQKAMSLLTLALSLIAGGVISTRVSFEPIVSFLHNTHTKKALVCPSGFFSPYDSSCNHNHHSSFTLPKLLWY